MNNYKKFATVKNALGLIIVGAIMAAIACKVLVQGAGDSKTMPFLILLIGGIAVAAGVVSLIKGLKKPAKEYAQYDRVDITEIDPNKKAEVENNTEEQQDYVFHFTGKLNQSYVMKDHVGREVFRADCGGIALVKDTDFEFINLLTGFHNPRKIGHTVTKTIGANSGLFPHVTSGFNIDGENCWDYLAKQGYAFGFSMNGIKAHYEVKHYDVPVGSIEIAGTEVMDEKYKNNPMGKVPTNGIFRISCKPSEVEGFFYICFCITKTDLTVS